MNDENMKRSKLEAELDELLAELDKGMPDPDGEDNIVVLNDKNGQPVEFEFMDMIEYKDDCYVVLLPVEDSETGEAVFLRVKESDGEEELYDSVDDDELLAVLFNIFKERFKDVFNFEDGQ